MKKQKINWKVIEVLVSKVRPTRNNYKLRTEEGFSRFLKSVDSYGLAGSVVINKDFELIDGNTRLEKAKELGQPKIWASIPDRQLTPKEFTEFSAMFDFAKAGTVDIKRIMDDLGTSDKFFKDWGVDLPGTALKNLAELEKKEAVINPTASRKIADEAKEIMTRPITLLFTVPEAAKYLELAEQLYLPLKTNNVTDASLKVFEHAAKKKMKFKADNFTDLAKVAIKAVHKDLVKPKKK